MQLKLRTRTAFTNTVLEEGQRSTDFPTMKAVEALEVLAVNAAGDAEVSCEIDDVTVLDDVVDPTVRRLVEPEVTAMKGVRAT